MSSYPFHALQRALVRSLNGRCVQDGSGVLAKDGERHENCATCEARCGSGEIGFSGGVKVARVWGSDAIELMWPCPSCGREVTQETTALASLAEAEEVKRDPLCYACRKPPNNNYIPDSPHKSAIPTGDPGVIRRDVGLTDNTRDGGEE